MQHCLVTTSRNQCSSLDAKETKGMTLHLKRKSSFSNSCTALCTHWGHANSRRNPTNDGHTHSVCVLCVPWSAVLGASMLPPDLLGRQNSLGNSRVKLKLRGIGRGFNSPRLHWLANRWLAIIDPTKDGATVEKAWPRQCSVYEWNPLNLATI